jgi:hypothetical protein
MRHKKITEHYRPILEKNKCVALYIYSAESALVQERASGDLLQRQV